MIKTVLASSMLFSVVVHAEVRVGTYQLAEKVSSDEIRSWDISIFPDGKNLPDGGS